MLSIPLHARSSSPKTEVHKHRWSACGCWNHWDVWGSGVPTGFNANFLWVRKFSHCRRGLGSGTARSTARPEHRPLAAAAVAAEFAAISRKGENVLGSNHTLPFIYSLRCLECSFYLICQGLQLHILLSVANKD